jgi:hypothetical protein
MSHSENIVTIRGRKLPLDELVVPRLRDEAYIGSMQQAMQGASPFPHLAVDGWFNPDLLDLVAEEFEDDVGPAWRTVNSNQHEFTQRTAPGTELGPACELYFSLVYSGWFVRVLSHLSGVEEPVVDPQRYGGGLHETRTGGHFGVHRDFDRHLRTGLNNEMVFITYLNKNWQPEWGGGLELWDGSATRCMACVEPEFGRSVLLKHNEVSYHGHPHPLSAPEGVSRRSIAAYYYSNQHASMDREARRTSLFLFESRSERLKRVARAFTPPAMWDSLAWLARRQATRGSSRRMP